MNKFEFGVLFLFFIYALYFFALKPDFFSGKSLLSCDGPMIQSATERGYSFEEQKFQPIYFILFTLFGSWTWPYYYFLIFVGFLFAYYLLVSEIFFKKEDVFVVFLISSFFILLFPAFTGDSTIHYAFGAIILFLSMRFCLRKEYVPALLLAVFVGFFYTLFCFVALLFLIVHDFKKQYFVVGLLFLLLFFGSGIKDPCSFSGNSFCFYEDNWASIFMILNISLILFSISVFEKTRLWAFYFISSTLLFIGIVFPGGIFLALTRLQFISLFFSIIFIVKRRSWVALSLFLLYFILFFANDLPYLNFAKTGEYGEPPTLPLISNAYYEYCSYIPPPDDKRDYFQPCVIKGKPNAWLRPRGVEIYNNFGVDAYSPIKNRDIVTNGIYLGRNLTSRDNPFADKNVSYVFAWSNAFNEWLNSSKKWTNVKNLSGFVLWKPINTS